MRVWSAPLEVFLGVTNDCNLRCRHCGVASTREVEALDTAAWLRIIAEIRELQVFGVRVTGGEPFVRPDLWTLLEALDRLPLALALNTNGTLIDEDQAARLARLTRLDDVMVGLDGADDDACAALRGTGVFARTLAALRRLVRRGLPTSLYCVVTRLNFRSLDRVVALARDLGVPRVNLDLLLPGGRALTHYAALALAPAELREAYDLAAALAGRAEAPALSGALVEMPAVLAAVAAARPTEGPGGLMTGCNAGVRAISIRPDGRVVPCDRMWDYVVGDLRHESLGRVWRDSPALAALRRR
ncbi:MAG: radical SAM protein, partial [Deltaproteobacteria bacterium]|nr:radical SAM protein [Deltaproteobacteria bacterium]